MVTGIYLRIQRDGRWENLDIAELTDEELRAFFGTLSDADHVKWHVGLVKWIRDNVAVDHSKCDVACSLECDAQRRYDREPFAVGDMIDAHGTWSHAEPGPHRVFAIRGDGFLRITADGVEPPYFVNPAVATKSRSVVSFEPYSDCAVCKGVGVHPMGAPCDSCVWRRWYAKEQAAGNTWTPAEIDAERSGPPVLVNEVRALRELARSPIANAREPYATMTREELIGELDRFAENSNALDRARKKLDYENGRFYEALRRIAYSEARDGANEIAQAAIEDADARDGEVAESCFCSCGARGDGKHDCGRAACGFSVKDPTDFEALADEVLQNPVARAAYWENRAKRLEAQSSVIYTVTCLKWNIDTVERDRCWGFYSDDAHAERAVLANATDMFECGYYDYAVIERYEQGIVTLGKVVAWFFADYSKDEEGSGPVVSKIDAPEWSKGSCNWGIG